VAGQPLTHRQEAYSRELEAWNASGVLPAWQARKAELEAERIRLHEQALPLDSDAEATDLLELLDEQTPRSR